MRRADGDGMYLKDGAHRGGGGEELGGFVAEDCGEKAEGAAMGDDDGVLGEGGGEGPDAGEEVGAGFPTGWGEAEEVCGPGVELVAGDGVPGKAFPSTKVEFLEAWVNDGVGGDAAAAAGRAADDVGDPCGLQGGAHGGQGGFASGGEVGVEAAVAVAGGDGAGGMTHEDDPHDAA